MLLRVVQRVTWLLKHALCSFLQKGVEGKLLRELILLIFVFVFVPLSVITGVRRFENLFPSK